MGCTGYKFPRHNSCVLPRWNHKCGAKSCVQVVFVKIFTCDVYFGTWPMIFFRIISRFSWIFKLHLSFHVQSLFNIKYSHQFTDHITNEVKNRLECLCITEKWRLSNPWNEVKWGRWRIKKSGKSAAESFSCLWLCSRDEISSNQAPPPLLVNRLLNSHTRFDCHDVHERALAFKSHNRPPSPRASVHGERNRFPTSTSSWWSVA